MDTPGSSSTTPTSFTLPPPTALSVAFAITRALQSGHGYDDRLAVTAYAQRREGISLHDADADADRLVLRTTDGDVLITFDAFGRIDDITSRSGR